MNRGIKEILDSATAQPPPLTVDIDAAVSKGDSIRSRRRWLAAGGAATSVAAIAAVVLLLVSGPAGLPDPTQTEAADGKPAMKQPVFERPEPEPGMVYGLFPGGFGDSQPTDETNEFTRAFWE